MDQRSRFVTTTARQQYLKRLRLYERQTVPVLNHYAETTTLLEIEGEQPREMVAQEIVTAIQRVLCISVGTRKDVQPFWRTIREMDSIADRQKSSAVPVFGFNRGEASKDSEGAKCHIGQLIL